MFYLNINRLKLQKKALVFFAYLNVVPLMYLYWNPADLLTKEHMFKSSRPEQGSRK
jgi:hypothetical protein